MGSIAPRIARLPDQPRFRGQCRAEMRDRVSDRDRLRRVAIAAGLGNTAFALESAVAPRSDSIGVRSCFRQPSSLVIGSCRGRSSIRLLRIARSQFERCRVHGRSPSHATIADQSRQGLFRPRPAGGGLTPNPAGQPDHALPDRSFSCLKGFSSIAPHLAG